MGDIIYPNNLPVPEISAGTEYKVCEICKTPEGVVTNEISPPHPVWTKPDGTSVLILDAVQLGGMFGLNS